MAAIFLFHGGNYKRGVDDERLRIPLTKPEIDEVFYDPEVPSDTDNSIATELNMNRYADMFCKLAVDDEIFVGLVPDAAVYRGLWLLAFTCAEGFTVDIDLIKCQDVIDAIEAGNDGTGLTPVNPAPLQFDFTNCVGDATCDAVTKAALPYGKDYEDYRNDEGMKALLFDPMFAKLGGAMYIRLKVTALGDVNADPAQNCCNSCKSPRYPKFQVGAIYDRLCADKQRHQRYCNCGDSGLCSDGCE